MFKKDGSGNLASRPKIDSAPRRSGYAQPFEILSAQAGSIDKVGLVRLGAPTHGDDQGQRYVPLAFTASESVLRAAAPANSNIAPPGYYMLFITDSEGVPSVAKIVKLDPTLNHGQPRPTGVTTTVTAIAELPCGGRDGGVVRRGNSPTNLRPATDKTVRPTTKVDGTTDIAVWSTLTGGGTSAGSPRRFTASPPTSRSRRLRRWRRNRRRRVATVNREVVVQGEPRSLGGLPGPSRAGRLRRDGTTDMAVGDLSDGVVRPGANLGRLGVPETFPSRLNYDGDGTNRIDMCDPRNERGTSADQLNEITARPLTSRSRPLRRTALPTSPCGDPQPAVECPCCCPVTYGRE